MEFTSDIEARGRDIADLFARTFTASEGPDEGALIGALARGLLNDTPAGDLFAFVAQEEGAIVAAAIFSRLAYDRDRRDVFLLSPMAVAPGRQGMGIGQRLLTHALSALRAAGVDVVMTYGDPAFYGKVGFRPIAPEIAPPPLPLSQPEGWIGQSLTGPGFAPLQGRATCAAALNDPAFW